MSRLPRRLHPGAWWLWAIGLAAAASRTTNPLVLLLFCAVAWCVVAMRRGDAPWARGFRVYVMLGLVIIAVRVVFRIVFGGAQIGETVLFELPELQLPDAAAGIQIGGTVTLEGVLAALYDGLRIATLLLCLGAANVLADPKRLLKALPGALHEVGVAVTVALTMAPQLIVSGQRIRRARRLRGDLGGRRHLVRTVLVPVLEDALDASLVLASAMDSRGYGRTAGLPRRMRTLTAVLVLAGVCGVCVGTYGVLDATTPRPLGAPTLAIGCLLAVAGLRLGGRRVRRTVYRPDPWRWEEATVVLCGIGAAALMFVADAVDPGNLYPTLQPLRWPEVGFVPVLAALVAVLPAVIAPPPRTSDHTPLAVPGERRAERELVGVS